MPIGLNVKEADRIDVSVPRVWFFPKTRLKGAIAGIEVEDGDKKIKYTIRKDETKPYPGVYRDDESEPVGHYFRKWGQYYPRLVFHDQDEALRQAAAPYVVFFE